MKAQDIIKQNYPPSILIYGTAGTGKTALVSQLEGGYLFDFDRGMRTAAKLQDKFFEKRNRIEFDVFRDENPMQPTSYQLAVAKMLNITHASAQGKWKYDACVIDSLTGLCQAAQLQIQAAGGDAFKKMEIQNWGSLITEVEKVLVLLRSLRILTVVTAHVDWIEQKKVVRGKPTLESEITDIFPSSATTKHGLKKLMWLFDEVLYADQRPAGGGKISYRVTGNPTEVIKARTRSQIGTIVHNEIGMVGLLEKMGYRYGEEKK